MYPILFEIGPLTIASFGLMVALGFLSGWFFINKEFKRHGLNEELGSSIVTAAMIGGLVGAKLYFVLFELPPQASWADMFSALFSGSGLTWYGGFVVAAGTIIWIIHRNQVPLLQTLDVLGISLAIGYGVGRIGCQLAGDGDYGIPTDLPWAMAYPNGVVPTLERVHPTPVYETLAHLGIFGILWSTRLYLGNRPGLSFSFYLILTGIARFLVEYVRLNPRVLWGLSPAQLISLVIIAVGGILAIRIINKGIQDE